MTQCTHRYHELSNAGIVQCPFDHSFDHVACFRCVCGCEFKDVPGAEVQCPNCSSVYVAWTDYDRFEGEKEVVWAGCAR